VSVLVRAAHVLLGQGLLADQEVLVDDGVIVATGSRGALGDAAQVLEGSVLAPGYVDVHVHALDGRGLIGEVDVDGLSRALLSRGVTSFLATTIATPVDDLELLVKRVLGTPVSGARLVGVHLEGPWLSGKRAGAQPPDALSGPDLAGLERLLAAGPPVLLTVAPELPGALEVIERAAAAGVRVALGHSDATYDEAVAGVRAGARHITHCFNAMSGLHHREPGLVGAALDLPELTVELIADGVHVHPAAARILWRAVGADRVCLVSDAVDVALAGEVGVRLADGTLAGSRVGLDGGVRNLVAWGIPLTEALRMASRTPAVAAGRADLGTLEVGSPADLVLLDTDLCVQATMVGGEIRWQR
jgi:N-acetylglucosamine-6-phosphate deacetylase